MNTTSLCRLLVGLTLALPAALPGCAAPMRRSMEVYDAVRNRAGEMYELAEIRSETREELSAQRVDARRLASERQIEAARADAERLKLEADFCRANLAAERDLLAANIHDKLQSKVAFNVEQGLEVGELEVDVEQLKQLLAEREQQPGTRQIPAEKPPCSCCDKPCGCRPGVLRRFCPLCRHKKCEAEKDCGGPAAVERITQHPAERTLKPAEIPLRLPVRLTFGMQNPAIETTKIIRVPATKECPPCGGCGRCHDGVCHDPVSCTQAATFVEPNDDESGLDAAAIEEPAPPTPPTPQRESTGNTITLK